MPAAGRPQPTIVPRPPGRKRYAVWSLSFMRTPAARQERMAAAGQGMGCGSRSCSMQLSLAAAWERRCAHNRPSAPACLRPTPQPPAPHPTHPSPPAPPCATTGSGRRPGCPRAGTTRYAPSCPPRAGCGCRPQACRRCAPGAAVAMSGGFHCRARRATAAGCHAIPSTLAPLQPACGGTARRLRDPQRT
jgi:hypothetical protein